MNTTSTQILDSTGVNRRIERIAFQIYEDNPDASEVIIAGIAGGGSNLAKLLATSLEKISPLKAKLVEVKINKRDPLAEEISVSSDPATFSDKPVVLVDDVLNSGKTLIYGIKPFLDAKVHKLRMAVLIDRDHKRYPIKPDFVGFTLSTTLQEHVEVVLEAGKEGVFLS